MNKKSYIIAFLIFILSTGGYMAMPLFPILTEIDDITIIQASSLTAIYIFIQMVTPVIFGPLGDTFGYKRMASLGETIRGIGFIGIGIVNGYYLLVLFAALAGLGGGITGPSLQALMMKSGDSNQRPKLSSLKSSATNLGLLIGPSIAGVVIWLGEIKLIFIVAGILYLAGSILLRVDVHSEYKESTLNKLVLKDFMEVIQHKEFLHFLIFTFFYYILFAQLFVTFPEYAKSFTNQIQSLFFINSFTGLLLQYPVGNLISSYYKPRFYISIGILFLFASYLIIGLSTTSFSLYIAIILFTIGQIFILPIIETSITYYSDKHGKMGLYFGISKLSDGFGRPLGSLLGGWLLSSTSPKTTWLIFAIIAFVLYFYYWLFFIVKEKRRDA